MVDISRVRLVVGGSAITGPGVVTFYTSGTGVALSSALLAYYTSIANIFPPGLNFSFPSGGEVLDSETGDFVSAWSGATATTVVGAASNTSFTKGAGLRVVWATNGVTNGRRVRGSTFHVPITGSLFASDGEPTPTIIADLTTKTNTFRTAASPGLGIWRRPKAGVAGGFNSVTGSSVPQKTSWLITRRT